MQGAALCQWHMSEAKAGWHEVPEGIKIYKFYPILSAILDENLQLFKFQTSEAFGIC